ncbi:MAG: indolepyruvate ferredoxin oxidoreductase subunit alpha [Clostridia bacterium]|nr:indolepyruvate ferredoxin oxidoreductase subunit alpha [Clostridia bacterium]
MGNEAIALGAMRAGLRLAAGYPGTPSTEILETVAKNNHGSIHVEWSINEKAALEVAAGAAYSGARALVTMKQMGLNVAADPLMSLAYVGVKGGLVVVAADDPGPISSQTEQDTRHFAQFAKLPVFDPVSPEEAYLMIADAFAASEKYGLPVLLRPTTRVCHGCASIELLPDLLVPQPEGFVRDPGKWVIFPRLSYRNHLKLEADLPLIGAELSALPYNRIEGNDKAGRGVALSGISYAYAREIPDLDDMRILKIGTPHPFPERLARQFLDGLDEVLVLEELDPVVERALLQLAGQYHLPVKIHGKLSNNTQNAGENSVESIRADLDRFLGRAAPAAALLDDRPALPERPPVLCPGCPHRASFLAVKQAARGKKAVFCGDIGCYTLGNTLPLDMVDTCLCMGAGVTVAQGVERINPHTLSFAFIGDSTFFASGITGVANAVYNQSEMILIVLDNATTAMTGHQPHPGTGRNMMGQNAAPLRIEKILRALGVDFVEQADSLDLPAAVDTVKRAIAASGVRCVIFESPCVMMDKTAGKKYAVSAACTGCDACIKLLGCPALIRKAEAAFIEPALCKGCGLCAGICPQKAILEVQADE